MDIHVEAPDGSIVVFPEGTADSVMEKVMQESYPQPSRLEGAGRTIFDIFGGLSQGLDEGVSSVLGMPTDIANAMRSGADYLGKKAAEAVTGRESVLPPPTPFPFGSKFIQENINKVIPAYEPKGTAGEYARTIGQFLPAAGKQFVQNAILPAVMSETAGQITEGTSAEPYARFIAAVTPTAARAGYNRINNSKDFLVRQAGNLTREDYILAQALMDKARAMGTPITTAEALQQVTNGRTMLPEAQRMFEQTEKGAPALRDFYATRPETNQIAAQNVFNTVAPASSTPSMIAPSVQNAAAQRIETIRKGINEKSEPYYTASAGDVIPTNLALPVQQRPAYNIAEEAAREHPVLGYKVAGLDADQIGVMDATKKRLSAMYEKTNLDRDRELASEFEAARARANEAMKEASPNYATALEIQNEGRSRFLEPAQRGPIGQLADAPTFAGQQKALFNTNPIAGSEKEVAEAITSLAKIDDKAVKDLVRQHLETTFNESTQNLMGGANQAGGAKWAANIAGNKQQEANLKAAIQALPNGDATWAKVQDALDVFRAQGRRLPYNSSTEPNRLLNEQAKQGSALAEGAKTVISPGRWWNVADTFDKWRYNRVAEGASKILTDPKGASILGQIDEKMPLSLKDFYAPVPYLYQLER